MITPGPVLLKMTNFFTGEVTDCSLFVEMEETEGNRLIAVKSCRCQGEGHLSRDQVLFKKAYVSV